jgi:hypothetical protein
MPGAMNHSASDVLRYRLVELGHGTLPSASSAWPIYVSQRPDKPDQLIVITDTGGFHDGRVQADGEVQGRDGCQILIRANTYTIGFPKANDIAIALDESVYDDSVTIGTDTYTLHSVSRTGSMNPVHLGKEIEASKRDLFSINCTISVRQTS